MNIVLCVLRLLYCCADIQSHPRGLPYVSFLLLSLSAYTTHTLNIAVSSVHVIICTQSDRKYTQLWDIMYHTYQYLLNCIPGTHIYVSSTPGEALHSLFFLVSPPFASFVGLPLARSYKLARLSVFLF